MNKSEKTFRKIWMSSVVILFVVYSLGIAGESAKGNKERVTVELIQQKNGCADCHAGKIQTPDGKEKDVSLAEEVKNIPKHPQLDAKANLKVCMTCHNSGVLKTRFINSLHDVHLNSQIYVGEFKQTCSGCHNMKHIKGL